MTVTMVTLNSGSDNTEYQICKQHYVQRCNVRLISLLVTAIIRSTFEPNFKLTATRAVRMLF